MTPHLVLASTAFGLATAVAAYDRGASNHAIA